MVLLYSPDLKSSAIDYLLSPFIYFRARLLFSCWCLSNLFPTLFLLLSHPFSPSLSTLSPSFWPLSPSPSFFLLHSHLFFLKSLSVLSPFSQLTGHVAEVALMVKRVATWPNYFFFLWPIWQFKGLFSAAKLSHCFGIPRWPYKRLVSWLVPGLYVEMQKCRMQQLIL